MPHPNSFVSSNWDSDPKFRDDIGEQHHTHEWYDGQPTANWPRNHVCGTAEQWSRGQALPPITPVPLNDEGVPVCCGAVPPPPPAGNCLLLRDNLMDELLIRDLDCLLLR